MTNVTNLSRLTLIRRTTMGKHPKAIYRCTCGAEKELIMQGVTKGNTLSCGCLHKERITKHGLYKHPLYQVWADMKDRCYNENAENYADYGGRGVRMYDGWIKDFRAFYDWCMSNGWKKGLQVDKDINGFSMIYSPDTCVCVTSLENNNAKRNNRFIEFGGEVKTIAEWARVYGVHVSTLCRRVRGLTKVSDVRLFRKTRFKAKKGQGKYSRKQT